MEKGKAGCTDVCELLSSKLHAVAHIAVDATVHSDATAAQVAVKEVSLLNSSQSARLAKLERLLQRVEKTRRATVAAEAQLMALKSAAQGSIWPRLEHEAEIERMLASTLPKPAAKKTEGGAARPANPASDAGSSGRFQCVQHFAELPVHLVVPDDVPSEEAKGLQEADATSEAAGQQEGRDAEGEGATFQPWQHPKPVDSKAVRESRLPPKVVTTVMTKPQGFAEKEYGLALQNFECKGCGTKLKKGLSLKRLGTSWDSAHFCYYTGYYYCADCHPMSRTSVIPARVLNLWDFAPQSVSQAAADMLELQYNQPLYCVSAVNPPLYEHVRILSAARYMRVQLTMLHGIGVQCSKFRKKFYTLPPQPAHAFGPLGSPTHPPTKGSSSTGAEDSAFIPEAKRYLVEDTEFWSLADLTDFHEVQPSLMAIRPGSTSSPPSELKLSIIEQCAVTKYLRDIRDKMIVHVVGCRSACLRRACQKCPHCEKTLFRFDLVNVRSCPRCKNAFHKTCWEPTVPCESCHRAMALAAALSSPPPS